MCQTSRKRIQIRQDLSLVICMCICRKWPCCRYHSILEKEQELQWQKQWQKLQWHFFHKNVESIPNKNFIIFHKDPKNMSECTAAMCHRKTEFLVSWVLCNTNSHRTAFHIFFTCTPLVGQYKSALIDRIDIWKWESEMYSVQHSLNRAPEPLINCQIG